MPTEQEMTPDAAMSHFINSYHGDSDAIAAYNLRDIAEGITRVASQNLNGDEPELVCQRTNPNSTHVNRGRDIGKLALHSRNPSDTMPQSVYDEMLMRYAWSMWQTAEHFVNNPTPHNRQQYDRCFVLLRDELKVRFGL